MIPVFYDERMLADSDTFSPSAHKPGLVVTDWLRSRRDAVCILSCQSASKEALRLAHDGSYVRAVLGLTADNGFGNRSAEVARSVLWTVGSMLTAARWAAGRGRGPGNLACSPTSGFHHAGHGYGGGYCTFNGLMVAARALLLDWQPKVTKVGILDCDNHFGDGTTDIIKRLGLNRSVKHFTNGRPQLWPIYRAWLATALRELRDCDVVLYQAGADQHIDDPLGGFLTTEQMIERDRMVFRMQVQYGVPMVWNLAGGYQRDPGGGIGPVLDLHRNTLDAIDWAKEHA